MIWQTNMQLKRNKEQEGVQVTGYAVVPLCLLDLTAAFDTVDNDRLTLRLERQFGLRGVVLWWFCSYLSDRVVLDSNSSFVVHLLCSVPQGSVLDPHMFIMYMSDQDDFDGERQMNFRSLADDTQTYLHYLPGDVNSVSVSSRMHYINWSLDVCQSS